MNTMKKYNSKLLSITGLALAGILFAASPVQADCDKFPTVPWWGNLDHERVASFVSRKHDGDWNPYIEKWSKQVDKLKGVHKRESSVFVRYKGKKVKICRRCLKELHQARRKTRYRRKVPSANCELRKFCDCCRQKEEKQNEVIIGKIFKQQKPVSLRTGFFILISIGYRPTPLQGQSPVS